MESVHFDIRSTAKPKIKINKGNGYKTMQEIVSSNKLHTVCEEARCPNIFECWERGTSTIMILGDICTRACGFCSVNTGRPNKIDLMEPYRTAQAVKKMNLRHVVITSVDRDDIKDDYGSQSGLKHIANSPHSPNCTVEVLTPDFQGNKKALLNVFNAKPEIFSHNIECVERISKNVRKQSVWSRSLDVLKFSVDNGMLTKTGMMVGLGERKHEVVATMKEIVDLGVEIFTIGQYLQPTKNHLKVDRYVENEEFLYYKEIGIEIGFKVVESGSLVRSSYHADEQARLAFVSN